MCLVWHYDVVGIYVKFGGEQLSVGVGVVLAIATILIDVERGRVVENAVTSLDSS